VAEKALKRRAIIEPLARAEAKAPLATRRAAEVDWSR